MIDRLITFARMDTAILIMITIIIGAFLNNWTRRHGP